MSWIYIPAEAGKEIETICDKHFNMQERCNCPLWGVCGSFANDLTKTDAENTKAFELGMLSALNKYKCSGGGI